MQVNQNKMYKVKPARPQHSFQLSKLFRQALRDDFDYYDSSYLLSTQKANSSWHFVFSSLRRDRLLLGLWHNNTLAGYVVGALRPGSYSSDIFWVYVEPNHRGRGLGKLLVAEAIAWLRNHHARVVQLVTYGQVDFYKGLNFTIERFARGFVGGRDVYIMNRNLL